MHWFRRANKYHMNVRLSAQAMSPEPPAGRHAPIAIDYDFRLDNEGGAPPGMPVLVQWRTWVVDTTTHVVVDRCDFYCLLVAGIRGEASGTFVWLSRNPGPGKYRVMRWLRAWQPVDGMKCRGGDGKS
jgi:hypothetical protein